MCQPCRHGGKGIDYCACIFGVFNNDVITDEHGEASHVPS